MLGKKKERWQELCELAAKEQDPQKVLELTAQIDRLLQAKQDHLKRELLQELERFPL